MSKKLSMILLCVFTLSLSLSMVACGDGDGEGGGGAGGGTGTLPIGLCNANTPCPDGQFCFNGLCALGCQNDDQCASNQHCDIEIGGVGWCKGNTVPTCSSDSDCALSQECRSGICSQKPVTPPPACEWKADGTDGCAADEVCMPEDFEDENSPSKCFKMPPCSRENTCPVGLGGAACNADSSGDKLLPSKDAICMPGLCREQSNCPAGSNPSFECTQLGPIGFCQPKIDIPGSCTTDGDCADPTPKCCEIPMMGSMCMPECL